MVFYDNSIDHSLFNTKHIRIMNILKKIARHILGSELLAAAHERKSEIEAMIHLRSKMKDVERYAAQLSHKLADAQRIKAVIPDFMLCSAIECLPNANSYANGIRSCRIFYKGEITIHRKRVEDGGDLVTRCRFIALSDGIEIRFCDVDVSVKIPLREIKHSYSVMGVDTEINTHVWDFSNVNFALISSRDFELVSQFRDAQEKVIEELF